MNYGDLLPEIVVLATAIIVLLSGSYLPRQRQWITRYLAYAGLLGSAVLAAAQAQGGFESIFDGSYALDLGTTTGRILVPVATIVILLLGSEEFSGSPRESETYSLILLSSLGTIILAGTNDLLILASGYLLATIPLYALLALSRSRTAAEASLKTYLLGALLSAVMLLGIAVLTGIGRGTEYTRLEHNLASAPVSAVALGAVAILAGLMFKAGAVPGHFWIPDATQASTGAVATYITTIPKLGALLAALRFVNLLPPSVNAPLIIGIIAAGTMTLGNLAALTQSNIRRLLGWSTVSQVGYLLLPVAVIGFTASATPALIIYLIAYALTNIVAFATMMTLPDRVRLKDWAGTAPRHPVITAALVVSLLSLVGTPPTAVFVGKLAVFVAAWNGGLGWLVVAAAANTVLSLVYYLRWIVAAFAPERDVKTSTDSAHRIPAFVAASGSIAIILGALLLFVLPGVH